MGIRERLAGAAPKVVADLFGCDLRSLAVMRIGLGLLVLLDLFIRGHDLRAFFTDEGVLPRAAVIEHLNAPLAFSLYMGSGHAWVATALFGIAAVFGLMMAVGWKTRLATVCSWLLLVSLQNRNTVVLQSGDVVFRLLLFWSMFLPMGARASVDALLSAELRALPRRVLSLATVGLTVQLASIYVFTAALKSGKSWFDGTAVYYALNIDLFAKQPIAGWLAADPIVYKFLTWSTLCIEWAGPFLLLFPWKRPLVRTLLVTTFVTMHMGFSAGLAIGLFSSICVAGWAGLLPGELWDRLGWRDDAPPLATVEAPGRHLASALVQLVAVAVALALFHENVSPWISWPTLGAGLIGGLLLKPRGRTRLERGALQGLLAVFILLIFNWNLSTVNKELFVPRQLRWIGNVLRLDQRWEMFAPYPLRDDGWWVIPGKLANGKEVDVWTGESTVDFSKPPLVADEFETYRWRKYMRNIWTKDYKKLRLYYAKYLCRSWNATHTGSERLRTFQIVYVKELTPPPGGEWKTERVQIWNHNCTSTVDSKEQESTVLPSPGDKALPTPVVLPETETLETEPPPAER